jgi:UDP-hydrolysing UDP-N-acetyl-D-glucosamine 2-epimerase
MRHALTKLSHLHLVSHRYHAERVAQMGEDPESVIVVGAPGLDNLYRDDLPDLQALECELDFSLGGEFAIVTVHPTTLAVHPLQDVRAIATAMESVPLRYVVTQPNADEGGVSLREFWQGWAQGRSNVLLVDALGERRYWGLLRYAACVLGNSSSGIIEAPAAGVPALNVGDRQKGRLRGSPLIADVPPEPHAITQALRDVVAHRRARVRPPRAEGPAAPRIVEAIARWNPGRPPRKAFVSQGSAPCAVRAGGGVIAGRPEL